MVNNEYKYAHFEYFNYEERYSRSFADPETLAISAIIDTQEIWIVIKSGPIKSTSGHVIKIQLTKEAALEMAEQLTSALKSDSSQQLNS